MGFEKVLGMMGNFKEGGKREWKAREKRRDQLTIPLGTTTVRFRAPRAEVSDAVFEGVFVDVACLYRQRAVCVKLEGKLNLPAGPSFHPTLRALLVSRSMLSTGEAMTVKTLIRARTVVVVKCMVSW